MEKCCCVVKISRSKHSLHDEDDHSKLGWMIQLAGETHGKVLLRTVVINASSIVLTACAGLWHSPKIEVAPCSPFTDSGASPKQAPRTLKVYSFNGSHVNLFKVKALCKFKAKRLTGCQAKEGGQKKIKVDVNPIN